MRSLLVRCYPARWRERYGDEFLAVLEERPLAPFDVADILLGALDARLRSRGRDVAGHHARGFIMSLRIGGIAAILGAALLGLAGLMASDLLVDVQDPVPEATFVLGLVALLVALTGLSAFQGRAYPRTSWTAFGLAAFGMLVILFTLASRPWASDDLWGMFFAGTVATLGGVLLFAITTYVTAALSRVGAVLIAGGIVVALIQPIMAVGLAGVAIGWLVLGIDAVRRDRPRVEAARPA
jgi:hypothetical protein